MARDVAAVTDGLFVPEVHYHVTNGIRTYVWSRDEGRAQRRMLADNRDLRLAGKTATSRVYACYNPDCFVLHQDEKEKD